VCLNEWDLHIGTTKRCPNRSLDCHDGGWCKLAGEFWRVLKSWRVRRQSQQILLWACNRRILVRKETHVCMNKDVCIATAWCRVPRKRKMTWFARLCWHLAISRNSSRSSIYITHYARLFSHVSTSRSSEVSAEPLKLSFGYINSLYICICVYIYTHIYVHTEMKTLHCSIFLSLFLTSRIPLPSSQNTWFKERDSIQRCGIQSIPWETFQRCTYTHIYSYTHICILLLMLLVLIRKKLSSSFAGSSMCSNKV